MKPLVHHQQRSWADGAYTSGKLVWWCKRYGDWDSETVGRDPAVRGSDAQTRRWVVERTFASLVRNRCLRIDYEPKVQPCETLIEVASIDLLVRGLARAEAASFGDERCVVVVVAAASYVLPAQSISSTRGPT